MRRDILTREYFVLIFCPILIDYSLSHNILVILSHNPHRFSTRKMVILLHKNDSVTKNFGSLFHEQFFFREGYNIGSKL